MTCFSRLPEPVCKKEPANEQNRTRSVPVAIASAAQGSLARRGGFIRDTTSVAERALRSIPRDPEVTIPALFIPVFMYIMTVGALNDIAEGIPGLNYRAFQIPVAVLFAVTGISRAIVVVTDIQTGYFDRLVISPVNRLALLLGLMIADFALVTALTVPVIIMAFIVGVSFATGAPGILAFMFLSGLWGLIFTGFPYAIALKTGNPAAVSISFLLFFPFLFMTTLFVPHEAMTGWLGTAADYNPVTYLLAALRSLISNGWEPLTLVKGLAAILGVGVVSIGLSLAALKGRATRK